MKNKKESFDNMKKDRQKIKRDEVRRGKERIREQDRESVRGEMQGEEMK